MSIIGKSLENNNIELIKDIRYDDFIEVYSRELLQVLINIIKNAKEVLIELQSHNKLIKLSCFEESEFAVIEICDNGSGIAQENMEKIFEPYFSTKDEKTGTGLGLYMSKTIVEKHLHGILQVRNNQNGGACFTIKLPKISKREDE